MSDTHRVQDTVRRHLAIADAMSDVFDQADLSVTVRFKGSPVGPRFALVQVVRVLDAAGLIDDTPIGETA